MLCSETPYLGNRVTIHTRTYRALRRISINKPVASPNIPHGHSFHTGPTPTRLSLPGGPGEPIWCSEEHSLGNYLGSF